MKDLSLFGLSALVTVVLAKISVFVGIFSFLQSTAGLWYPISVGIASLGFRTELLSQGIAMVLFVGGTTMYIVVKAETFGDRLAKKIPLVGGDD